MNGSVRWLLAVALFCCASLVPTAAQAAEGDIFTVAGTSVGFSGDGGLATAAEINVPTGVAATPDGGFLIADTSNHRIRKVSPTGGITTVAGTGTQGFSGDNGPATAAELNFPLTIAPTPDGGFLFADGGNFRIRKVSAAGTITTVAGTTAGSTDDDIPATEAQLQGPTGVALTADGGFLIADVNDHRVRKVSAAGIITTVAGDGTAGLGGDNGPATAAQLDKPAAVAATADGGFLIADFNNHRIRKVDAGGTIFTVAGTTQGFSGDNGPATAAKLDQPSGVAVTADGGYLIADRTNHRVRKVDAAGTITTVAGTTEGLGGDGGPATAAQLSRPHAAVPMPDGGFLIADTGNSRIRRVAGQQAPGSCGGGTFFVILGKSSADTLVGTEVADAIIAGGGQDVVSGLGGGDCLLGGDGADQLSGGADGDHVDGGENADTMNGEGGPDTLIGDDGADTATGGDDADQLKGNDGNDVLSGDAGLDTVLGAGGVDILAGGTEDDRIEGAGSRDTLTGEDGNDQLVGGSGGDRLAGGTGRDRLSGGTKNDRLAGGSGRDKLSGGGGRDNLAGAAGRDKLTGGPGRDRLKGGRGRDKLIGGQGNDRIICGPGRRDVAVAGTGDRVAASCEKVR